MLGKTRQDVLLCAKKNLLAIHPGASMWSSICWTAWILLIYSGEWFEKATAETSFLNTQAYLYSTTALSIVFILFALLPHRGQVLIANMRVVLLSGFVASTGTAFILLSSSGVLPFSMFYVGNIMTGAGTAFIGMKAAVWFSGNPPRMILVNTGFSLFCAMMIFGFVLTVPEEVSRSILVLLPIISAICSFLNDDQSIDIPDQKTIAATFPRQFWRFVMGIFLLTLALSLVRGYYPNFLLSDEFSLSRNYSAVGCVVIAAIFTIAGVFAPKRFNIGKLCYWANVGVALLFALLPVVGLGSFVTGSTFAVASAAIFVSVWCLMSCIAFKSGASALPVFGFGFVSVAFGSAAGWWIGDAMFTFINETVLEFISVGLMVLVVAICLIVFRQNDLEAMAASLDDEADGISSTIHHDDVDTSKRPRFRLKLEELARQKSLSEREFEVFALLARGKGARTIAEELMISYNTARVHVSNIYAKFGVHSKAELQRHVEETDIGF